MPSPAIDPPSRDQWAEWLLHRRYGGDPAELQRMLDYLYPARDKVLANASLGEGDTLLDVGTGDGLIAFGALERVGATGRVVFSDISQDLLDVTRDLATEMDVPERCRFVQASADDLTGVLEESVDAVTTRSVLIYVADKQRAFDEFARVLRSGGRISLFEPVNRYSYEERPDRFWGYDVGAVQEAAKKIQALYDRLQPIDRDPMMNFDERDLLAYAERAGFDERHLELHVDIQPLPPRSWDTFVHTAFNPRIPTLNEAMDQVLTSTELDAFVAHLRPLVEIGQGLFPLAVAYVWALKS